MLGRVGGGEEWSKEEKREGRERILNVFTIPYILTFFIGFRGLGDHTHV